MTKKKRRSSGLAGIAERYAISLIFESTSGRIGRGSLPSGEDTENSVPFKERRALLDSRTKLLDIQKDGEDDESSGLSSFMERLKDDGDSGEAESGADNPTNTEDSVHTPDDII